MWMEGAQIHPPPHPTPTGCPERNKANEEKPHGGQKIYRPKFEVEISMYQVKASPHSAITALMDAPNEHDKMAGTVFVDY
jgi:hypothetical protein